MGVVMDKTVIGTVVLAVGLGAWAGWRWLRDRVNWWPHVLIVAALVTSAACITLPPAPPQEPGQPSQPGEPSNPAVAVLTVAVTPSTAIVQAGERKWPTRPDGTIVEEFVAGTYAITVTAPGYIPHLQDVALEAGARVRVEVTLSPVPAPPVVDWCATKTEAQFRDWRGDIGGVRLSFDTSPTRGRYFFTPTYMAQSGVFADAGNRAKALAEYKARGYTHFAIGPMYEAGYPGWPGHDYRSDPAAWIARVVEIWAAGLIPVHWLMPNGPYNAGGAWDTEIDFSKVNAEFSPLLTTPDMQRVTCMVVAGWEVTDKEWVKTIRKATALLSWQASTFPRAYRYWHAAVDNGAPCNYDEDGEGCEGKAWRAMAPYIHGHFWQTGAAGGWNLTPDRDPAKPQDRINQFLDNLQYEVMRMHTNHYVAGGVRGADGKLLDVIVGEYSAYFELNDGESEDWGRSWGRLGMTVAGVRGFGDGG
jgi:hypothetical protein